MESSPERKKTSKIEISLSKVSNLVTQFKSKAKIKKLVLLLFSAILIVFTAIVQEEKISKEELEEVISNAKVGKVEAQYNLGVYYFKGEGITKNDKQAKYWWNEAKKQGHKNKI